MARSNGEYKYKTVRTMKDVEKHLKKGWEVVESSGKENWFWGSDYQALLRRRQDHGTSILSAPGVGAHGAGAASPRSDLTTNVSPREPQPLPRLDGHGVVVEFDGETLRVTPTSRVSAMALGGKKGETLALAPHEIAGVDFKEATRLVNGKVTVQETSGAKREIHFTWQKAGNAWRELAEMLAGLSSRGN